MTPEIDAILREELHLDFLFRECGLNPRELYRRDELHNLVIDAIETGVITLNEVDAFVETMAPSCKEIQ